MHLFQKRFEGTLVNPQTFFEWKAKFDAEFAHLKVSREKDTGKLTGREMFMRDTSLIQSDLKFLEDSEGNAEIHVAGVIIIILCPTQNVRCNDYLCCRFQTI